MIYCFDIDGTICTLRWGDYENAEPFKDVIKEINSLYDQGNQIIFMTARGSVSGIDWSDVTKNQLNNWGLKYHQLLMNIKPHADLFIDDKGIEASRWRSKINIKRGLIAGSFDLVHPGYIVMFEEAKTVCNHLIVALQTDPTIDRPEKNDLVHTLEERKSILSAIKYIDEILVYDSEESLYSLLQNTKIDLRILGSDYINKDYTGKDLNIPVHFHCRDHSWSATKLREKIFNKLNSGKKL